MAHISEHINSKKPQNHSHYQTSKMIVNLGINKWENNNNSTCQISRIQKLLLMSIVDTPEKDLSNVDIENQTS